MEGAVNVDLRPATSPDVVHSLDHRPVARRLRPQMGVVVPAWFLYFELRVVKDRAPSR
ncbi:hypothetical protein BH24ACI5_BH24ACI5_19270 [soil metagenome]